MVKILWNFMAIVVGFLAYLTFIWMNTICSWLDINLPAIALGLYIWYTIAKYIQDQKK